MSPTSENQFEFLLFDGFSNLVLASALEPLRDVKLRAVGADLSWRTLTLDGQPIRSSSGLNVMPDAAFDAGRANRTLVLVGGYRIREQAQPETLRLLRKACRGASAVMALDTTPWLLAATGLLDGQQATIHWQELEAFEESFPKVEVTNARYARAGKYLTCGGAGSTMEMILALVQERFGSAAAFDATNMFLYDAARQNQAHAIGGRLKHTASPKLLSALDVMAENIQTPLTTFELAKRVFLSERSLNRLFQAELGMTPGHYYRLFRLNSARYLAEETTLSQEQIALRCGFSSGVSLARSFRSTLGMTLKDCRAQKA